MRDEATYPRNQPHWARDGIHNWQHGFWNNHLGHQVIFPSMKDMYLIEAQLFPFYTPKVGFIYDSCSVPSWSFLIKLLLPPHNYTLSLLFQRIKFTISTLLRVYPKLFPFSSILAPNCIPHLSSEYGRSTAQSFAGRCV